MIWGGGGGGEVYVTVILFQELSDHLDDVWHEYMWRPFKFNSTR